MTSSPTSGMTSSPTSGMTSSPTSGMTSSPTSGMTSSPTKLTARLPHLCLEISVPDLVHVDLKNLDHYLVTSDYHQLEITCWSCISIMQRRVETSYHTYNLAGIAWWPLRSTPSPASSLALWSSPTWATWPTRRAKTSPMWRTKVNSTK